MFSSRSAIPIALLLALGFSTALASEILPPTPAHIFGGTVIEGDTMVATAKAGGPTEVYVYSRMPHGGWSQPTQLVPTTPFEDDGAFFELQISGDLIGVSTVLFTAQNVASGGAVFLFHRDSGGPGNWGQTARIDATDYDALGSITLFEGTLAVALRNVTGGSLFQGWLYESVVRLYQVDPNDGSTWSEISTIDASDSKDSDGFGRSLAMDGDRLFIGATGAEGQTASSGAAYLFERNVNGSWSETAKIFASDGNNTGRFGWSIALAGDTILIGSPKANQIGGAYFFERDSVTDSWTETQQVNSTTIHFDRFGEGVLLVGEHAAVRAPGVGRVMVLGRSPATNAWEELTNFTPPPGSIRFGGASGSGDTLLISSDAAIFERGFSTVFHDTFDRGDTQNWTLTKP